MRLIAKFIRKRLGRSGYLPVRNVRALDQIGWLESFKSNQPIDSAHQPVPWFTYAAISFLDQIVREEASVLEIGGATRPFGGLHVVALSLWLNQTRIGPLNCGIRACRT
jgi:hypothetical protein